LIAAGRDCACRKFGSGAARVSDGGSALSDLQVCAIVGRASAAPSPEVWFWSRRVSDGGYALSDLQVYTIVGRASVAPPPEV